MIGTGKILLVMQFYGGDKARAMELSRLIADIEPCGCRFADFAFLARFDCIHDPATAEYMRSKFSNVHFIPSKRRKTGWPQGPNAMAMDLFTTVHDKTVRGQWNYDAVQLLESDDLPLRGSWIEELWKEWHEGNQLILGDWIGSGTDLRHSHINGNLMFSPQLTKRLPRIWQAGGIPAVGWDAYYWVYWAKWSRGSKLIYSDYRSGTAKKPWQGCARLFEPYYHRGYPTNPLNDVDLMPCLLHGCKSPEGIKCVRNKLGLDKGFGMDMVPDAPVIR